MKTFLKSHRRTITICCNGALVFAMVLDVCGFPGIAFAIRPLHLFIVSSRLLETIVLVE